MTFLSRLRRWCWSKQHPHRGLSFNFKEWEWITKKKQRKVIYLRFQPRHLFYFLHNQLLFFFKLIVFTTCDNGIIQRTDKHTYAKSQEQLYPIHLYVLPFPRLFSNANNPSWFFANISFISRGLFGFATNTCKRIV